MAHIKYRNSLLVLFFILILLSPLSGAGRKEAPEPDRYDTTAELQALIDSGEDYLLVDVRTPAEYESGHIPTAINIPYTEIVEGIQALPDMKKDIPVVVYCRSGSRSARAYASLIDAGYRVYDFGGILSWEGKIVQ